MTVENRTVKICSVADPSSPDANGVSCDNSYILYYQRTCDFRSCRSKVCKLKATCDHPFTVTRVEDSQCEFLGKQQDLVGLSLDEAAGFSVTSSWTFKRAVFLAMSNPGYHVSFTLERPAQMQLYFFVMTMEDVEDAPGQLALESFRIPQESPVSLEPMAHSSKQSNLLSSSFSSWTSTIYEPETILNFNQDDSCHIRMEDRQLVGATRNPLEMQHTQAFIAADLVRRVSMKKSACNGQGAEGSDVKRGCFSHICRNIMHFHRKSKDFPDPTADSNNDFVPPQISLHFEDSACNSTCNMEHKSDKQEYEDRVRADGAGSQKMKIHKK
ncbi:hypothetical protein GUITHDRAFT_99941 [Guillardia theta CCMP2712]|uniref:Uncharacterized protein n=1 Tax=Guillardia theta (strain CCMP2712) TaxID=905079 RepID=L1K1H6_GUITC|nr:hypothetical protein GUITHDRAFT_99941 [Guillardia theta CCMP2712]EKX54462.1 hypothetical protein GUITHDRAFT_99941 [Guillardia theta CCMP2712]|eukprot:XP_005841442.1 hypothetical protein GUITHDRAFT_99941 [Guillardia theta CCMP2712]